MIVQELADQCISDETGYDPLPQHVVEWMREKRDDARIHDFLADHLADLLIKSGGSEYTLWQILSPEAMRTDDLSAEAMVATIRREAFAYCTTLLCEEVDAAIDAKMAGYLTQDDPEFVDEWGGAL